MPALPKSSAATSHQVLNHWKSHGTDYNWQLWSEDLTDWSRYLGNRGWMWGGSNEAQSIATIRSAVRWKDAAIYRDSRPARIRQEIEDSLRRLRTDVIDLYQAHWPDLETSVWETARTLEDLRRQGNSARSASATSAAQMDAFDTVAKLDAAAADQGSVKGGYIIYGELSTDSAHPSAMSLDRYVDFNEEENHIRAACPTGI